MTLDLTLHLVVSSLRWAHVQSASHTYLTIMLRYRLCSQLVLRFCALCHLLDEARKDTSVDGIQRIPVQQPKQPTWHEIGGLPQLCSASYRWRRLKLEPRVSRHLHLSPHAQ